MQKFQSRELSGCSGRTYTFTFFEGLPEFRAPVGGVYLVAVNEGEEDASALPADKCFLIGESKDLRRAVDMLRGSRAQSARGRQLFGILQVNDSGLRSAIQSDLMGAMEGAATSRRQEREGRGLAHHR